ncbi:D-alanyl-D-alanine carboxypeptidase family protein [Hoeflea sp. TYP-13]|uniref:D-alanyl-D-alanine carboxypeptidase family protein n=1 Tax=Hoeflea sp. TYP-13 TaxID=3230023 RepID=UPI0034C6C09F
MINRMGTTIFSIALAIIIVIPTAAFAQLFQTKAKQAYLIEAETGTVLFAKDEDDPIPPASLAKLMTMELVFNALKTGQLSLDDEFEVSENAWRTGGAVSGTSTMFAEIHSSIRLEDLMRGVIVQSGNDACIVIAEGMAGSEANFAEMMTERARELGLEKSVFANSTGLPDPAAGVTMRELAQLARHIQQTYPEYYSIYSEDAFEWNGIYQRNRNPLLRSNIGVDGLKTGFTEESGYAIVSSIERKGRRLFLAMSGMSSIKERAEEARKMLEWGLRAFEKKQLFADGEIVGSASVYGGEQSKIPLMADGPINIMVPITNADRLKARIVYNWPLTAPVEEGRAVGLLKVWIGDTLSQQTPLYAAASVQKGPLHKRALDALLELGQFWH